MKHGPVHFILDLVANEEIGHQELDFDKLEIVVIKHNESGQDFIDMIKLSISKSWQNQG